jgi:uncharacterized membrane protein YeiH
MNSHILVTTLDFIATFAFAVVGARIAASRNMDYGGITLIAGTASLAGGTLRNLFIGVKPAWITNPYILIPVLVAVLLTIAQRNIKEVGRVVLALDTFGLAVATVSSVYFALSHHIGPVPSALLGVTGGVTGGLLRDVLCQLPPVLLHRETIGTSCLAGAAVYVILDQFNVATIVATIVSGIAVVAVREISISLDLNLPRIKK